MANFILFIVLVICVVTDIKSRKILNIITLPAIIAGLILYTVTSGYGGFLFSGKGLIVGLGVLLVPYILGGIGAGDVKLMAAIGAMKGSIFVCSAFLFAAIIGGVISFYIIVRRKELKSFLQRIFFSLVLFNGNKDSLNVRKEALAPSFPYGVAIALGTLFAFFAGGTL